MQMKNELMITLPSSLQSKQESIVSKINGFGTEFSNIITKYQKSFGIEKAVAEKAPTFHDFAKTCGEDAVKFWLRLQIFMAFDFVGISMTASEYQIRETADLILSDEIYSQLTLAEFMCFITKFKRGYFGKIYQSQRPNPQEFLMCLTPFWNELCYERGREEERRLQQKREEESKNYRPPTPEEQARIREIQERLSAKFSV